MNPGDVTILIDDDSTSITMAGGASWTLPLGPRALVRNELELAPRPTPEQLTNALGAVTDHLDDVLRESPMIAAAPSITIAGYHACVLARVELGTDDVPAGYALQRSDADEVFRTLVAEPISERVHNPGLPARDVETIIGTCCIVLAIMRRLELSAVEIAELPSGAGD
jgi:exopolyphosphatase/pppGpp-phosphohydrolase